jgi:toxin CcdB
MPQFTVHMNPNPRSHGEVPYLVDVQSDLLEGLATRVVIPLMIRAAARPMNRLAPAVFFEGRELVLMTPQLAGVNASDLGAPVGSLADQRDAVIAALDFLFTGF